MNWKKAENFTDFRLPFAVSVDFLAILRGQFYNEVVSFSLLCNVETPAYSGEMEKK